MDFQHLTPKAYLMQGLEESRGKSEEAKYKNNSFCALADDDGDAQLMWVTTRSRNANAQLDALNSKI